MTMTFPADRLDRIAEMETNHFWFASRRTVVASALRVAPLDEVDLILDVGCGTGASLRSLAGDQWSVGIDQHGHHLRSGPTGPAFARGDVTSLPVASNSATVVLALDVLEHVSDRDALREIGRVLRPEGRLVATVPADPRLWSRRDEEAGHLRRYTTDSLRSVLEDSGFTIERLTRFQAAIWPLVAASRRLGRRSSRPRDLEDRPHPAVNALLRAVTGAEARLVARGLRPPWGTSLLVMAVTER